MPERPSDEEIRKWHRWFAVECNNRAWELAEAVARTAEEDREMLHSAHASALHWSKAGTERNAAAADLLLGHVHALLGHGAASMSYAQASLDFYSSRESEQWELAFAHAVLANAASASGDVALHKKHHALAEQLGLSLPGAEDRAIFEATFRRVPVPA